MSQEAQRSQGGCIGARIRPHFRHGVLSPAAALLAAILLAPPPAGAAAPGDLEGLWQGRAIFERAEVEADLVVELARKPEGPWVGTIDVPNQRLRFHPLDAVRVTEGDSGPVVELVYSRFVPERDRRVPYEFRGRLSDDGGTLEGEIVREDGPPVPFVLEKLGPPGTPRPEPREMAVRDLSPDARELRDRFHRDRGRTRLLMLLSPT